MLNRVIRPIVKKMNTQSTIMQLNRMSDHQLSDIGITRSQIKKFVK